MRGFDPRRAERDEQMRTEGPNNPTGHASKKASMIVDYGVYWGFFVSYKYGAVMHGNAYL